MRENDGDPNMIQEIIDILNMWRTGYHFPAAYYTDRILRTAIRHQDTLGWKSFIEGFQSTSWRLVLGNYLSSSRSQKSPLLRMSRVQQKLWGTMKASLWTDKNNSVPSTKMVPPFINTKRGQHLQKL